MDLWSVGVCLFELYTGKFMFTGRNNNDMLKQFLDYKVRLFAAVDLQFSGGDLVAPWAGRSEQKVFEERPVLRSAFRRGEGAGRVQVAHSR
jgi:hypothetical protein